MSSFDMFNASSIKQFMLDVFSQIVYEKYAIDISGLRNPTELFNFLQILKEIHRLYQKHGCGNNQPDDIERLKSELNHFCREYRHILPEQWIQVAQQLHNSNTDSVQYFYINILTWWNGLGQGLLVVKAVMYTSQWNEVCRTKENIQQLIQAGYDYVHLNSLNQKLTILQERANRVEQLVRRYRLTQNDDQTLLQEIRRELREANESEYKQIMQIICIIKINVEGESQNLSKKRQTVSTLEKVSWLGAITGAGLVAYSHINQKKSSSSSSNNRSRGSSIGWTVAAASIASLGYTTSEKSKLEKLEELVKDRLDRLTSIDVQLSDVRQRLDQYQNWTNGTN